MKRKILAVVTAITIMLLNVMPVCAADAEITEAGTSNMTVTAEVTSAQAYWFKVKLPTAVSLAYNAEQTAANAQWHNVIFDASVTYFVKGHVPDTAAIFIKATGVGGGSNSELALIGAADPSHTILARPMTPSVCNTPGIAFGNSNSRVPIPLEYDDGSSLVDLNSNVDYSAAKGNGCYKYWIMADPVNPYPDIYTGSMQFTITAQSVY